MFWSSPVAFERAAFNLAHFYGYAPEDGDKFTQFVEHMYNTTAMVRFDLYASGAFVGRLPLTYKADVAINVSSSGYRMYRAKWRHLPATAVFFYNGWGDEVLCFRTVSMVSAETCGWLGHVEPSLTWSQVLLGVATDMCRKTLATTVTKAQTKRTASLGRRRSTPPSTTGPPCVAMSSPTASFQALTTTSLFHTTECCYKHCGCSFNACVQH
jgi:hypothetical protein